MAGKHATEHGCGLTKAACDTLRQQALGKCSEMTADQRTPTQCRLWATSLVGDAPMCTAHAGAVLTRSIAAARVAEKRAVLDNRIEAYIDWRTYHPSVWDAMPVGYAPESHGGRANQAPV